MAVDQIDAVPDPEVRVLIVDDQPVFLGLAREIVDTTAGFRAVGSARSGRAALDWLRARRCDLVIMDVRMPGGDGVLAAREVAAMDAPPVVLLCSSDERPDIEADPRAHGAHAFHRKEHLGRELLRTVWGAHGARRRATAGR